MSGTCEDRLNDRIHIQPQPLDITFGTIRHLIEALRKILLAACHYQANESLM